MKKAPLSGSLRENVGKKDADQLRSTERVPGVLYGGSEQIHFHVSEIDLKKLVYSPDVYRLDFDINGKVYPAIIKDMQFHPVTDKILHMDCLELVDGKEVEVALPVRTTGSSIGVRNGGRLATNYRRLPVKALPNAIPECVEIDVTEVKIGDSVRVRDVSLEGCNILLSESAVILDVKRTRAAMAAEAAADEGAAPAEGEQAEEAAAE